MTREVSCVRTAARAGTSALHLTPPPKVNTVLCIICEHPTPQQKIARARHVSRKWGTHVTVRHNHHRRHDLRRSGSHQRDRSLSLERRHIRTPAPIHRQRRTRRIEFSRRKENGRDRLPIPFRNRLYGSSNLLRSKPQLAISHRAARHLRNSLRHPASSLHDFHHNPSIPRPKTQILPQLLPQPARRAHVHRRPLDLPHD